jgi:pimeloyl-ACP methyl ester carboxylesterase
MVDLGSLVSTGDVVVTPSGIRLAVRDYGGEGPPILLVHGLSSNVCIWDIVGPRLAQRHRVVAYDQRGHGHSDDAADYGFESLADDLAAVVGSLERPIVVGHSWGASVALHYAVRPNATTGIVCVDGAVTDLQAMGIDWSSTEQLLRPPELEGPADELLERIKTEQAHLPWKYEEHVVRRSFVTDSEGIMRRRTPIPAHMKIVRELWEEHIWDAYERISVPVMLVLAHGVARNPREQGFVAAKEAAVEEIRRRRPDVRVEWLDSVHDIPLANPDELSALIEDFSNIG